MRMFLMVLSLLLCANIMGEELRIVDVVRQGPPPYVEEERLYRIEGVLVKDLKINMLLQVRRKSIQEHCGVLMVTGVGPGFAHARLLEKGKSYPLKGDLIIIIDADRRVKRDQLFSIFDSEIKQTILKYNSKIAPVEIFSSKSLNIKNDKPFSQIVQTWIEEYSNDGYWVIATIISKDSDYAMTLEQAHKIGLEFDKKKVKAIEEEVQVQDDPEKGAAIVVFWGPFQHAKATGTTPGKKEKAEPGDLASTQPRAEERRDVSPKSGPVGVTPEARHHPHWTLGLIGQTPSLVGNYYRQSGSSLNVFDTERDLRLGRSSATPGVLMDYRGTRHLFHLGIYGVNYRGDALLDRDVAIDTTTYHAGAQIQSAVRLRDYELDWTIKVWRPEQAYLGVDLGLNYWDIRADVVGQGALQSDPATQVLSSTRASLLFPLPQVGISGGVVALAGLDLRGYFHLVTWRGASYRRYGLDARYFPFKRVGFRMNLEQEGFRVPLGSLSDSMSLRLDKNGVGFGVVFRP